MTTKQRREGGAPLTIHPNPSLGGARVAETELPRDTEQGEAIWYVENVQERLGRRPDGSYVRSSWWVRMHVAPTKKRYMGRLAYWLASDVEAWLAEQFEQRKSA